MAKPNWVVEPPKPRVSYAHAVALASDAVQMMQGMREKWETNLPREALRCTTCKESVCCDLICLTTLPEALIVTEMLASANRRADLEALIAQGTKQLDYCGPEYVLEGKPEAKARVAEWSRLGEPCVLLKDGKCSVYENAPLVCRSFYVLEGPVPCKEDKVKMIDMAPVVQPAFIILSEFCQEAVGSFIAPMPLGAMVSAAIGLWSPLD